ncbi:HAMP domain-containing sensor histidine kinase [Polymorphospora sp. NPDC051019]|uniref:sensor histidine kinase n=1 Tax=Polymorphospora sp. NPDC051019 TaxID=3155725 RepID=UPI0034401727
MIVHLPLKGRVRGIPLRVKLVAAVLALVTAALVVIGASSSFFLHRYLVDQIDAGLGGFVNRVKATGQVPINQTAGLPTDYVAVLIDKQAGVGRTVTDQRFAATDLPNWPTSLSWYEQRVNKISTVHAAGNHLRWRVTVGQINDQQLLVVGQSLAGVDQAVRQLILIDVLVGCMVLLLLASIGAAIVATSLRPLVEIERTAAAIAAGDLTKRVPDPEPGVPEPRSELGRLSQALNAMLAQIEAAFTAQAVSEAAARRSEERMRQFVADASHELRTPLTTIRGFAELYRQGAVGSPEDTTRLVRRIEDEASRMGLLVEDLLLLARLDKERPLTLAPVELPLLAADAVQAAAAVAPERAIGLEVAQGAGPLVVYGDDARLRQILGNLMTNAVTHTPSGATVTLRLRRETGDLAVVEVADTGPGLSPEQAERVFERFYRADAARTRRTDGATGAGLGLAIVAALVAAHQGSVEVVETPGGGATFRVRLPLAPSVDDPPRTVTASRAGSSR